jgi:L-glyceraldehyde 3-phosphate reductase
MVFSLTKNRYQTMQYRRCGQSGLKLPPFLSALAQLYDATLIENSRQLLQRAFDLGITHFDLANNYGPPPGSAECNFGRIFQEDFQPWRDELIISTKAGYTMWDGPYGDWGSRKYLISSLDQSLKRLGLSMSISSIIIALIRKRRCRDNESARPCGTPGKRSMSDSLITLRN